MVKLTRMEWEDFYFDGRIDPQHEIFDEDTQSLYRRHLDDGWDNIEKIKSKKRKGYVEDGSDDWYRKMKNGNVKRK